MNRLLFTVLLVISFVSFSATITWKGYKEINSPFTVASTDVLVIEPGTTVLFNSGAQLIINGEIRSNGTALDPVLLSSLAGGETKWDGIIISSMSLNNEFNYTNIRSINSTGQTGYAGMSILESTVNILNCSFFDIQGDKGGAIKIEGGNVTIQNSSFHDNSASDGGAVCILNVFSNTGIVNIYNCEFKNNQGATNGGAVYIYDDYMGQNMTLNIADCDFLNNNSMSSGGAIFYQNEGKTTADISRCRFAGNSSGWGSAIYGTFMMSTGGDLPLQRFSNLVVVKNTGYMQSGIYLNMGTTPNPTNLKFTNSTIAYNTVMLAKAKQDNTSGIYIMSNGNYPMIENAILWGNADYMMTPSNYWIEDFTSPDLNDIFKYCDIEEYVYGGTNINLDPLFINPPVDIGMGEFDFNQWDMHESVLTPCSDSGDPALTDPDGSRLNIGAYGGTAEAAKPYYFITDNFNIPDNTAGILDVKNITAPLDSIRLGANSQIFIKASENTEFFVKSITSPLPGKPGSYSSIEPLRETSQSTMLTHRFNVSENLQLLNTKLYNIKIKVQKESNQTKVSVEGINSYAENSHEFPNSLEIVDPDFVSVNNSRFSGAMQNAIKISRSFKEYQNDVKAAGRLTNNSVSFDSDVISKKSKSLKRFGIEISNANIDIEDNMIEGGDVGIYMKSSSSGKISNNCITFETDPVIKTDIFHKTGILYSDNQDAGEISHNRIFNNDCVNSSVIGIELNNSNASILYNTISFEGWAPGSTRAGIKIMNATDSVKIYNNTIFNTLQAFLINYSTTPAPVEIINNIFWSDQYPFYTINDTTKVKFYNNCFSDSTDITGPGNIFENPQMSSPSTRDFTLYSISPCINAGTIIDGVHTYSEGKTVYYYGAAPDMGAYEFYQDIYGPANVITTVSDTGITFTWDSVPGYYYYNIYASHDPYGTYTCIGSTYDQFFTDAAISEKRFYYITASTDFHAVDSTHGQISRDENIKPVSGSDRLSIKKTKKTLTR